MKHRSQEESISFVYQFGDQFLDETIAFWQPRSPHRKLTREDAREIVSNLAGFFQVLRERDEEERAKEKPVAEYPRPLIGLELEKPIISGRSCQVFEMRKIWEVTE